jgi:hypothetical protein
MAPAVSHRWLCWLGPALIALGAGLAVLATLDPAGSYPTAPQGPGLTVDERFNVGEGVRLAVGLRAVAAGEIGLTDLFNDENPPAVADLIGQHLPDHPPLGRLWIGVFHQAAKTTVPPHDPRGPLVVACARTASAAAFAVTVFLAGWTAARWYGTAAGLIAAASLVLMPRVFGHAHLASLETFIGLTYAAAVLCVAHLWVRESRRSPGIGVAAIAGVVFGLALLTKIQAVFLPAAVAVWAIWHWRLRAILPLAVWTAIGLLILFGGWPWLWLDPPGHLAEYLGRAGERMRLNAWYFGVQYADRAVPWHYPFVMFLVTVPVGLHLLAAVGFAGRGGRSPAITCRERLLLAAIAVPLAAFAWPGIAVYDGARLFLVVFPLWAVFVGRGGAGALDWLKRRRARVAAVGVTAFVLLQGIGLVLVHPAYLSYYNVLVGGLPGARAIGLELSYWGDSVTRELLEATAAQVPAGSTIDFTPVLEPHQLEFLIDQSPLLRERRLRLRAFEDRFLESGETQYLLYFHRHADIAPVFRHNPAGARLLAEVRRQGVQLAALYAFD